MSHSDFWSQVREARLGRVLLVYAGASWAVLEATDFFVTRFGLPELLLPIALGMLLVGFVVIIATALMQARPAEGFRALFTWRNAIMGGALAFGLWGVVATGWLLVGGRASRSGSSNPDETIESVAVLPFADLSSDGSQEYFGDGLAEELLNVLTRVPGLKVAARTSAFAFKGRNLDVRQIGDTLNVETVLEGSVRKSGDRVRVTAQLVNVSDGFHLWSETYDREFTDILSIQDEISRSIVEALKGTLSGEAEAGLAKSATQNVDAYNDYLRGRHFWNRRTVANFDSAVHYFNRAVLLDPEYARAYAGLAETLVLMPEYGGPSIQEVLPYAKAATERALALDPDLAEAYVASGYRKALFEWDWKGAERDYQKAIELDPGYATAHQWYAELLAITRRWDEAVVEALRAYELDPLAPAPNFMAGITLSLNGRSEEALARFEAGVEFGDEIPNSHYLQAFELIRRGDYERAGESFERMAEVLDTDPEVYSLFLAALSDSSLVPQAVNALENSQVFGTVGIAEYLGALGAVEKALAALETEHERGNPYLPWANTWPELEGLRPDPRMRSFLAKMDLTAR